MQDATSLLRAGDLTAATASIQAALGASDSAPSPAPVRPGPAGIVIDVEAREVGESASERKPPQAHDATHRNNEGEFVSGRSGDARAERDYRLYVPPQAGERPLPLVVMLHGCTQDPDDFAAGTRMNEAARALGCFVLYPAQSRQANPQGCWNWFKHNHQQRGRGEAALLAAMTRHVMARHDIDPARVYVAGLSAGGAMAAILGDAYPDLYAAVGVHSGLACGAAKDLPTALAAMRSGRTGATSGAHGVPTIVFHGDADGTVHPDNGQHVIRACAGGVDRSPRVHRHQPASKRSCTQHVHLSSTGDVLAEHWVVHGSGHAWSGGSSNGTYTDSSGPDATREMLRFFLEHPRRAG